MARPQEFHPFPTRRSSDLRGPRLGLARVLADHAEAARLLDEHSPPTSAGALDLDVHRRRRRRRAAARGLGEQDRKSTRLNSSHEWKSYAVFCLKKKSRSEI